MSFFVSRLYNVCLGREATADEIAYHVWCLDNGQTGIETAGIFVFSEEFKAFSYCDRHYVEALYRAFMGREPSANEIDAWAWRLQQGDTREDVFNSFATSEEFGNICAAAGIMRGNAIDFHGQSTHMGNYCSVEGCTAHEGIVAFVTRLYNVTLDRDPQQSEIDYWVWALSSGMITRDEAIYQAAAAPEFQLICASHGVIHS